ncbi:LSTK-1-like kinase [Aphelenchoides bicaudatus]|nr:LSTK-1-like kinase [Aphelenchoides bicaudatus]
MKTTKYRMQLTAEQFCVVRDIGEGAFGKCMLARHAAKNQTVVLKQLKKENAKVYENECQILSALSSNSYIVKFKGKFSSEQDLTLVMGYAEGGSLSRMIKETGVKKESVLVYFLQLTDALNHLHLQNILHRDIKPDNIFLCCEKTCVLGDFGSAIRHNEADEKDLFGNRGTDEYCAFEVLSGISPATDKSDMWSLGCVLYEMYERKPAFKHRTPRLKIENCEYVPMSSSTSKLGKFLVEKLIVDHNVRWRAKDVLSYEKLRAVKYNKKCLHTG